MVHKLHFSSFTLSYNPTYKDHKVKMSLEFLSNIEFISIAVDENKTTKCAGL